MPIRRRGSRRKTSRHVDLPPLLEDRHQPFEDLVADALDALPDEVQRLLVNVAIVIDDEPTAEQLRATGMAPGQSMYGLYEGVSSVIYGADHALFPNKITLFRLPLEEDFADPRALKREVQRTVIHELAHHAGFSDEALDQRGL